VLFFRRACEGSGATVLVWGEAGIGKTRLIDECALRAAQDGARVARTACFQDLCPPFTPLREVLASLGLPHALDSTNATGSRAAAEGERYRAFLAAGESLRDASRETPILITLDDLQWADFASLEFLAFAARRLNDARLIIIGNVRTDDLEKDHDRRQALEKVRREGAASIALQPLDDREMEELLRRLWPRDVPVDAYRLKRICALAEGKPYFAEELLSSSLASGDDAVNAAPLSIRSGVLSRFERLTSDAQHVLLYAAVTGRTFGVSLLAALTHLSIAQMHRVLAEARDATLVRELRDDAERFEFRHAITREILYFELIAPQARAMHREIAQRLEDDGGDTVEIAYHWTAAGEQTRATIANEAAGDEAVDRNAYRDAATNYRRAADGLTTLDARHASLCEKLAQALTFAGDLGDACVWGQRALDTYIATDDRAHALHFALFLARRYGDAGKHGQGIATVERAVSLLTAGENQRFRYAAHVTLAHLEAQRGRIDEALAQLERAESIPGEQPLTERQLFYDFRSDIRAMRGQLRLAIDDSTEAVHVARQIGEPERLSITLTNYARFAFFGGRTQAAAGAYAEALALAERHHLDRAGVLVGTALAYVYLLNGDLEAAHAALTREDGGGPAVESAAFAARLRVAFLREDAETIDSCAIEAAVDTAFRTAQPDAIGLVAGSVAAYYEALGRRRDAEGLRARALDWIVNANVSLWLLDQISASGDPAQVRKARDLLVLTAADPDHAVAHAHVSLFDARTASRRGDRQAAKRQASEAAERFDAIGWPWERAQALELSGRAADALDLYHRGGYRRDEHRVMATRRRARHRAASDCLTARELEVAMLAIDGKTNREIADALTIGERTVETHLAAMFDRFDLTSRHQLARIVERQQR